jgi:integral membrane sensor domain MASE1
VLVTVYFATGKLGLQLAYLHPSASPVWPPTGISLAAVLLLGARVWPGILTGAFLVNITTAGSVPSSLGIAAGNTLEALAGAWLVRRYVQSPALRGVADESHGLALRVRDVFVFAALAGMVSTTVSATCGVTSLALTGLASWQDFGTIWLTWWLGDAVGDWIVAPLILLWALAPALGWTRWQRFEAALLGLSILGASLAVFYGWSPVQRKDYPLEFLCLPLLVWAAFRFGAREAAAASFLLSAIAIWGTLNGLGPFARFGANESLLLLASLPGHRHRDGAGGRGNDGGAPAGRMEASAQ